MKLYLIRHGQTDWNLAGRIQGRQDVPLNETGLCQARCLARGMEGRPVTAIYASPQKRAFQTAQAVGESQGVEVTPLDDLMEIGYGQWEGRTGEDILKKDRELYEAWWEHPATVAPPGGETLNQVDERCRRAWDYIRSRMTGDTAVISHGGTLAHLIVQLLEGQSDEMEIVVGNATITTLEYEPESGRCRLAEINDNRHLIGEQPQEG